MIILTVVKDDPEGFALTMRSIVESVEKGLRLERWIIKTSGPNDTTLDDGLMLPHYADVCSRKDTGLYEGFNQAIQAVSEEYNYEFAMFLNSGDALIPSAARILTSILEVQSLDAKETLVFGALTDRGNTILPCPNLMGVGGLNACHQAILYKMGRLRRFHYSKKYRIAGDYFHFLEFNSGATFVCSEPIVIYNLDGLSEQSVLKTRYDNFRAGYSYRGLREVAALFSLFLSRLALRISKFSTSPDQKNSIIDPPKKP